MTALETACAHWVSRLNRVNAGLREQLRLSAEEPRMFRKGEWIRDLLGLRLWQ
jgi:hypothetical protein